MDLTLKIFLCPSTPKKEIKGIKKQLISDAFLCGYSKQMLSALFLMHSFVAILNRCCQLCATAGRRLFINISSKYITEAIHRCKKH